MSPTWRTEGKKMTTNRLTNTATETEFLTTVIELAQFAGWKVAHFRPARTKDGWRTAVAGDVGFPDLVLAKSGSVIFAELKSQSGRVDTSQKEWLAALTDTDPDVWSGVQVAAVASGSEHFPQLFSVYLWRPSDMSEIRSVLGI